jgi:hypothetical protein
MRVGEVSAPSATPSNAPGPGHSRRTRAFLVEAAALCVLVAAVSGVTQRHVSLGGNEASRFAVIEALVDHHRWNIDQTRFGAMTEDVAQVEGLTYSNKPVFLAVWGAAAYAVLKHALGWTFADEPGRVVYAVTFWCSGLATIAFFLLLTWALRRDGRVPAGWEPVVALAVALGTTLFSYSGTLNNHVPNALALLAALLAARAGRPALSGALVGVVVLLDSIFGATFAAALLVYWARAHRTRLFLAGLVPAAIVFLAVNQAATGFPLPLYLRPIEAGANPAHIQNFDGVSLSWDYPFQILFGYRGFVSYSPILALPLLDVPRILSAVRRAPLALESLAALATGAVIAFHAAFIGAFGGWAFGFRFFVPLVAVYALYLPGVLSRLRKPFVLLLAPSMVVAAVGAYCPWPPSYVGEHSRDPIANIAKFNAGSNLACLFIERDWPGAAALADHLIDPDPLRQLLYVGFFFKVRGDWEATAPVVRRWQERPVVRARAEGGGPPR